MADLNAVFQNCYYVGNNFNTILYGIELMLYFATVYIVLNVKDQSRQFHTLFLVFSTALLFLITIFVAVQSVFGEMMWIVNEDFPGGSAAYLATHADVWYQTMGSVAGVLLTVLSDALLLYRCYVFYGSHWIVVFPALIYLASVVLGILTCVVSGTPSGNFFVGLASQIAVAYSSAVISLNVLCSGLICARILFFARRAEAVLGPDAARAYTGTAAILIESALPYALFGIAYVAALGVGSPVAILFESIYVMFTCISPQLIILRILMGRAWTQNAAATNGSTTVGAHFSSTPPQLYTSAFHGFTLSTGGASTNMREEVTKDDLEAGKRE
ncbi:uncharacterized protein BXZ73DRAFT_46071 [Epithele typhae]|uniref:uncharacterized protein n=1 Tax=Epithele typhae TaxID=378194 RepID=UPI002007E9CD|nr:uncharacterized protein BXZ73DRAFT_46071 [Epithele typhae]KAH9934031.1 hypothetical protein BXZ73DRAFT_46071 [Epithele typhae]